MKNPVKIGQDYAWRPQWSKRPVIGNVVKVMRIATGKEKETLTDGGKNAAAVVLGKRGGKARAEALRRNSDQLSPNQPQSSMEVKYG